MTWWVWIGGLAIGLFYTANAGYRTFFVYTSLPGKWKWFMGDVVIGVIFAIISTLSFWSVERLTT